MSIFTDLATQIYSGAAGRFDFILALFNNTKYAKERLDTHTHDGVDSQLIPIGSNELRNGSFEGGTVGWTVTQYTGGTVAINTANALSGSQSLAFTSTVLANGGGDIVSNEFVAVTGSSMHSVQAAILAAVANLSANIEILWYATAGGAPISASTVYSSNNLPTALTQVGGSAIAPAAARYKKIKITGHIPNSVAPVTTGTFYLDGLISSGGLRKQIPTNVLSSRTINQTYINSTELPIKVSIFLSDISGGSQAVVYMNGSAICSATLNVPAPSVMLNFSIDSGATYSVMAQTNLFQIISWYEVR